MHVIVYPKEVDCHGSRLAQAFKQILYVRRIIYDENMIQERMDEAWTTNMAAFVRNMFLNGGTCPEQIAGLRENRAALWYPLRISKQTMAARRPQTRKNEIITRGGIYSMQNVEHKTKRLLSVLLALAMALALIPALPMTARATAGSADLGTCELYNASNVKVGTTHSFDAALATALANNNYTVKLLTNVIRYDIIRVVGKTVTFDLDGKWKLELYVSAIETGETIALHVYDGGEVKLKGAVPGKAEFNATGTFHAVSCGKNSKVTVSNAACTNNSGGTTASAVDAYGNSTVTVSGDVTADGNASLIRGISIKDSATVVVGGNVTSNRNGIYAIDDSSVTVAGNVAADGANSKGVLAYDNAKVTINGNVTANDYSVYAGGGKASVTVGGNVNSAQSPGVYCGSPSSECTVTVDGKLVFPPVVPGKIFLNMWYVRIAEANKLASEHDAVSDKSGYAQYSAGKNRVWVKGPPITEPTITTLAPHSPGIVLRLPDAPMGIPYSYKITATGTAPISMFVQDGVSDGLPTGLSFHPDGTISGTPTKPGSYGFAVVAFNDGGAARQAFRIEVLAEKPTITTTDPLPNAAVGVVYSQQFTAVNNNPLYTAPSITWNATAFCSLPPGLTLSSAGVLSGTPTKSGKFKIEVEARYAVTYGGSSTKWFYLTIEPGPPEITTKALSNGTPWTAYSQTLAAVGDDPITWSLESGALPAGLALSSSGVISGTPTAPNGIYAFTVKAVNGKGSATKALSIEIYAIPTAKVTSVTPSGADAPSSGRMTLWFDTAMDTAIVGEVKLNGMVKPGYWSSSNNKVFYVDYSGLTSSTPYTVTVSGFKDTSGVLSPEDSTHNFTTATETLTSASVTVPTPVAGEHPDFYVIMAASGDDDKYTAEIMNWYDDANGVYMTESDTFVAGNAYVVEVAVNPNIGYAFSQPPYPITLTINGGNPILFNYTNRVPVGRQQFTATAPVAPTITTASLPDGEVGTAYSQTLAATGDAIISWTLDSGDLPGGLVLLTDGSIVGMPVAAGTSTFAVKATNGAGSVTKTLTIAIAPPPLVFTDDAAYDIPASALGEDIPYIIVASGVSGGTAPYSFSATGLPSGIDISADGVISGIPIATGAAGTATITVTDADGATQSITIGYGEITPAPVAPSVTTASLPDGAVGASYSQTLAATGTAPIVWILDSGSLPDGLTLSNAGVISGTPTASGAFNFDVKAYNTAGNDAKALSITIADVPIDILAIDGVTAPVAGATPVAAITETAQYTGAVTWLPADAAFGYGAAYTATITLTPKAGFTLAGVPADSFTVAGATSVSNAANSGVISAAFPATAAAPTYAVSVAAPAIADGGSHTFAGAVAGYGPIAATSFTVSNTGSGAMTDLDVALSGADATSFTIDKTALDPTLASGGTTSFTIKPNDGLAAGTYAATVTITDANIASYAFTVNFAVSGSGGVTVPVVSGSGGGGGNTDTSTDISEPDPEKWNNPFEDVNEGDWFYGDVEYVYTNDFMLGTNTEPMLFSPDVSTTRGMIVTILYRMEGSPDASALENPFSDVPDGEWYADAVKWAYHNDIVLGYGNGKYGPDDKVTRQDLAVILNRYAVKMDIALPATKEYAAFADNADIAEYARESIELFFRAGVIIGKPGNILDPKGKATRAEFAAMLHRFMLAAGK